MAVLRRERPPTWLRWRESQHLREPVRRGRRSGEPAILHVRAQRKGRSRRVLSHRGILDHGTRLLHRRLVPYDVQRIPLLRGLLPELHLGHARGVERLAGPEQHRDVRRAGGGPGRASDRSRGRPVLRRFQRRDDPAHHVCGPSAARHDSRQRVPRRILRQCGPHEPAARAHGCDDQFRLGLGVPGSLDRTGHVLGAMGGVLGLPGFRQVPVHDDDG